jgi:hypothetical protein
VYRYDLLLDALSSRRDGAASWTDPAPAPNTPASRRALAGPLLVAAIGVILLVVV